MYYTIAVAATNRYYQEQLGPEVRLVRPCRGDDDQLRTNGPIDLHQARVRGEGFNKSDGPKIHVPYHFGTIWVLFGGLIPWWHSKALEGRVFSLPPSGLQVYRGLGSRV